MYRWIFMCFIFHVPIASSPVSGYYREESVSLFCIPFHLVFIPTEEISGYQMGTVPSLRLSTQESCSRPLMISVALPLTLSSKELQMERCGC